MGFIDQKALQRLCEEGQFKKSPTVTAATSRYDEEISTVMVVLVNPTDGEKIGTCAAPEIPQALEAFRRSIEGCCKGYRVPNPNIEQLQTAYEIAQHFKEIAEPTLRAEHRGRVRNSLKLITSATPTSAPH